MKKLALFMLTTAFVAGNALAQSTSSPVPSSEEIQAEGDSGRSTKHGVNNDADERAKADRDGERSTTGSGLRDRPIDRPATIKKPAGDDASGQDTTPSGLTRD
jgi:hypothetical protein